LKRYSLRDVAKMVKKEVEIPQVEYDMISEVAEKLGLSVETLIQQEVDRSIETVSCWMQRIEMLLKT
jgi:uncharacterized tellurite resistance protein B-like protein